MVWIWPARISLDKCKWNSKLCTLHDLSFSTKLPPSFHRKFRSAGHVSHTRSPLKLNGFTHYRPICQSWAQKMRACDSQLLIGFHISTDMVWYFKRGYARVVRGRLKCSEFATHHSHFITQLAIERFFHVIIKHYYKVVVGCWSFGWLVCWVCCLTFCAELTHWW